MGPRTGSVVLGRYRVGEELAPAGELRRWAAVDPATGEAVEVVAPVRAAALRPGARDRFAAAHTADAPAPAVLASLARGEEDGLPVAVRPADTRPLPRGFRISAREARAWLAWLVPAARAAADRLGGEVGREDLAIDANGTVRLAPSGLVRGRTLATPPATRPPEGPAGEAAAVYGVAAVVFECVAGRPHAEGRTASALRRAQERPRRLRDLDPGAPEDLDRLLSDLLSPDPARRLAAADRLAGPAEPPPPVAADRLARARPGSRPVALPSPGARSAAARPGGRADLPPPRYAVVVDAARIPPRRRHRAAALLGLTRAALARAAAERRHLVAHAEAVHIGSDHPAARRVARIIGARVATLSGQRSLPGALAVSGCFSALTLAAAVFAFLLARGHPALRLPGLALAFAAVLAAAGLPAYALHLRRRLHAAWRATLELARVPSDLPEHLRAVRAELDVARRGLFDADPSSAVAVDLLDAADEIDEALDALAREGRAEPPPELAQAARELRRAAVAVAALDRPDAPEVAARATARARAARAAVRELGGG